MTAKRFTTVRTQAVLAFQLARGCLIAAVIAGCADEGNRCDPGQTLSSGVCFAPDAATPPDAPPSDAEDMFAHFGDVCADETTCLAPTSFCVKLPGEASGYCTAIGCLEDPAVCPADWGCVDLSVYGPGLPAICSAP